MNKSYCFRISCLPVVLSLIILATAISCSTNKVVVDTKDMSYLYNPTKYSFRPYYNITNQSDNQSLITVIFNERDLFFTEANSRGVLMAQMTVSVKLYNTTQIKTLVDTSYLDCNIPKAEGKQEYSISLPMKVEKESEYTAEVKILDRIRNTVSQSFVPFNTISDNNRYNYKVLDHFDKNELYMPVMRKDEYFNIVYMRSPIDSLYISYYRPFKEVPDPPSLLVPQKVPDDNSLQTVALHYSDTLAMMLPREGIYHYTKERGITEGFTLFNFGNTFPILTSPEALAEPLAYLATEGELDTMMTAANPKIEVDNFWIKCGGNIEKARELIRIYYTRVQYANAYFTSFTEGWRTERGMIYLIYGPPDKVYKSPDGESWGYKKPEVSSKWGSTYKISNKYIFFNFKKRESKFTDNDYYLSRSETLVTSWDQAIASWKKGIVFRLDNPEEY